MKNYYRSSTEIMRQISDFKSTLPGGIIGPPPDDFAAKLQWDSWQQHLADLYQELDSTIEHEF